MPVVGDISYRNRRDARGKFTQQGQFNIFDIRSRPVNARLRLFEKMVRSDLTLKTAVNTLVTSVISSMGDVTHEDPEISEFLTNNILNFEQNNGKSWKESLYIMFWTMYWAGFSVTETMWDLKFGALYLDDLLTYHPQTLHIYPDKKGRLTDGQPTFDGYHTSGIYQYPLSYLTSERRLDTWKCIYIANEADYGNYYGRSAIAPSYKWLRLKEVTVDMMASALENCGRRLLYVTAPSYEMNNELRFDPATQSEKAITTLQYVKEQFESPEGSPSVLLIPKQQSDIDVTVGSLPLADNIAKNFIDHLAYLDQESVRHIVPYFLISDHNEGVARPVNIERRMEVYYNQVDGFRKSLSRALILKVFSPLIEWNFSRAAAKTPASFTRVYSDRPEDRVATMQMVKGLTEAAYLNPNNEQDWTMVRQMVRLSERSQTPEDLQFIQEVVINPRQKTPRAEDAGPGGSGGAGKPTGTKMPNQQAREPVPNAA